MKLAKLSDQLCFALYSASSHLTSVYRPLLDPHGLTYPQFIVLMLLWQEDDVSISSLAKSTGLTNATMTPLLKRLEQKGLIIRQRSEHSERQKQILLTPQGKELAKISGPITKEVFCSTGLSQEAASAMIQQCENIIAHSKAK